MNHLGDKLKQLRENFKVESVVVNGREIKNFKPSSGSNIARLIGTSRQYLQQIESGEHGMSVRMLIMLADFYNVPADTLITEARKDLNMVL